MIDAVIVVVAAVVGSAYGFELSRRRRDGGDVVPDEKDEVCRWPSATGEKGLCTYASKTTAASV